MRRLEQPGFVSKYISNFQNVNLKILDVTAGEILDKLTSSQNEEIEVEKLKSTASSFETIARIALNDESAIWGARSTSYASML